MTIYACDGHCGGDCGIFPLRCPADDDEGDEVIANARQRIISAYAAGGSARFAAAVPVAASRRCVKRGAGIRSCPSSVME